MTSHRTHQLLTKLDHLDVRLRVEGDRLCFDAPRDVVTPELREAMRQRKPELIEAVERRSREAEAVLDWRAAWLAALPLRSRLTVRGRRGVRSINGFDVAREAATPATRIRDVLDELGLELVAIEAIEAEEGRAAA